MSDDSMRAKARATFGKNFFENTKAKAPAKNEAVALQQRANARPIPTYKVGGQVKAEPVTGGSKSVPKTPERAEFEKQLLRQQKATGQTPAKKADGGDMKPMKPRETAVNTYGPSLSAGRVGGGMSPTYGGGQSQAMRGMNINRISAGGPRGVGLRVGIPLKKGGKVDNMDALKEALKSTGPIIGDTDVTGRADKAAAERREMADVEKGVAGLKGKAAAPKQSFGQAFKAAREAGVKTFDFGGKKFTTAMAGEKKAAPAAPRLPDRKAQKVNPVVTATAPKAAASAAAAPKAAESKSGLSRLVERNVAQRDRADAEAAAVRAERARAKAAAETAESKRSGRESVRMGAGSYKPAGQFVVKPIFRKDGGSVSPERIAARAASGMKKGGKAKPKAGLAVMIAIGKTKPGKANGGEAEYQQAPSTTGVKMKKGGVKTSSDTARALATEMGGMKCGGKPGKYAVGGAGKVRKGQAPIKKADGGQIMQQTAAMTRRDTPTAVPSNVAAARQAMLANRAERIAGRQERVADRQEAMAGRKAAFAEKMGGLQSRMAERMAQMPVKRAQGGAGKVRKGMMTPSGDITKGAKPKKGLGGL